MAILEIMDGSLKMINNFHRYDKIKSYMYLEKHTTMVDIVLFGRIMAISIIAQFQAHVQRPEWSEHGNGKS
jgi:hypothetical protein